LTHSNKKYPGKVVLKNLIKVSPLPGKLNVPLTKEKGSEKFFKAEITREFKSNI